MKLARDMQDSVVRAVTSLFAKGPTPLEHTLDHEGDPGLMGPDSVSWRVLGDAAVFVGGIRALVVQSAHPEVAAGVDDHSSYRDDPLGRLSRTSVYVTETTYGAMPEVEAAVAVVRQAHRPVTGTSDRDRPYSASTPELAAWVHNVLVDSFLTAYQVFSRSPINDVAADRFVREQADLGRKLRATDTPMSRVELTQWIVDHPQVAPSSAMRDVVAFLSNPPLPGAIHLGYRRLFAAAVATIPDPISTILGISAKAGAVPVGRKMMSLLRWSLGASPSWLLALDRVGAPPPVDVTFRRPPPVDEGADVFARWQQRTT